jgi:hypothetical protein
MKRSRHKEMGEESSPGQEGKRAGSPDVERHRRTERSGWPTLPRPVVGIQTAGLVFLDSWPLKIGSKVVPNRR